MAATENPTFNASRPAAMPKKLPTGGLNNLMRFPVAYGDIRSRKPFASISLYMVATSGDSTPGRISPPLVTVHTS